MKRIIIILVILVSAFISKAQTPGYTTINSGYDWLRGLFKALGVPAGGTAGFQTSQAVRAGALYYDSTGTDSGLYVYSGLAWRKIDGITYTANEGLQINSNVVQLGGLVSSPAALSNDRHILANRRILSFSNTIANNNWWQFSDSLFSPFQFASTDTITSNDMSLSRTRPISTMNIQRNIVFASGIYQQTKMYGALRASTKLIWGDSVKVRTDGGDYHTNIVEFRFSPTGTGRQRAKIGHGTGGENDAGEALPALIANMYVDNNDLNATDTTVINGTIAGIAPYFVGALGTAKIRVKRYISVQPNNFINANTYFEKYYDYASRFKVGTNSSLVDSAYFMWDTSMFKRNHLRGSTHIGTGLWSNSYNFSVGGISNFSDTTSFSTVSNIADTTGYDIMTRRRTDGVLTRITSTQLSSFIGGTSLTVDPPGSGNANGLEISGSIIKSHYAGSSSPGIVSTSAQSFTGNKTFNDIVTVGDELRAQAGFRLRNSTSGFFRYLTPLTLTSTKTLYFADDDTDGDTIATRGWARTNISGGGSGSGTVNSGTANRLAYYPSTGTTVDDLAAITANRALISDANGLPTHSSVTDTELGYVSGATSNIQTQIDDELSQRKWWWGPSAATTIVTVGTNAATTSGTLSTPTPTNTNLLTSVRRTVLTTAASSAAAARINNTSFEVWRGDAAGLGGFESVFRFGLSATAANNRVYVGWANTTSALSNVDHFTNTSIDRVGMYIDANTGNWNLIHNTSGSAATTIGLGANFPVNTTDLLELRLNCEPNASTITYVVKNLSTGNSTSGTLSSNLPTAGNWLAAHTWINTNTGSTAIALDVAKVACQTKY